MDNCSYFIEGKGLFGSYPNKGSYEELVENGVKYFVDLTTQNEKSKLYTYENNNYYSYQIKDRYIPENIYMFCKFIYKLGNIITNMKDDEKIYIHCKGGHGRCGVIVSCLLCHIFKYSADKSLELTNKYHNNRKIMNERWRKIGSPQTDRQKEFVKRLFKPIFLDNIYSRNTYYPLHNLSNHHIKYDNIFYKNVNVCYYSLKDRKFYNRLNNTKHYYEFKKVIENISSNKIKGNEKLILTNILKSKFTNNNDVKEILTKTLLKPIRYTEDNINIGEIWEEIRSIMLYNN